MAHSTTLQWQLRVDKWLLFAVSVFQGKEQVVIVMNELGEVGIASQPGKGSFKRGLMKVTGACASLQLLSDTVYT
jgi:hypothetical protein